MSELRDKITDDMKAALKAKDKKALGAVRLILAAIKQKEIDERIELSDNDITQILTKLAKQRKESISQYQNASRDDLVAVEQFELDIISKYLPEPLSEEALSQIIDKAISDTEAKTMADMGKVMAKVKQEVAGRADMGKVSQQIKATLSS